MGRIEAGDSSSGGDPRNLFGYSVLEFIGEGAGSRIYRVKSSSTGKPVALKHVLRKTDKDVRFIEQLENEFAVSQQFSHPGLRRSLDCKVVRTFLRKPTEAILVMELFEGIPLDAGHARGIVPVLDIFIQVAEALAALHHLGLVHCDLKPNNILVNEAGVVKVIDFGQACPAGTAKKRIQGTPDYISPEQVKLAPVTPQTDVYNFGATLYWTLTGKSLPTLFTLKKGENSFLFDDLIKSPSALNPQVPESLSGLVMECVKTNPAKRPADLSEVARRLEIIRHSVQRNEARSSDGVA